MPVHVDVRHKCLCTLPATGGGELLNEFALSFNGIDEVVSMGDSFGYDADDEITFSAWVRSTDGGTILAKYADTDPDVGYSLELSADYITFRMLADDETGIIVTADSFDLADGGWNHLVVTYDGSRAAAGITFYVNASPVSITVVQDDMSGTGVITNAADFEVGFGAEAGYFTGDLDEVGVWNDELTLEQVEAVYGECGSVDLTEIGVVAGWYRMGDDDVLPTVADWSGNGITATATNMDAGNVISSQPGYYQHVEVSAPAPGEAVLPGNDVTVSGTISSPGNVTGVLIWYDGGSHAPDSWDDETGAFSDTFATSEGVNDIEVEATYDDASEVSAMVTIDTTQASLIVDLPVEGWAEYAGDTMDVGGTVTYVDEISSFFRTYSSVDSVTPNPDGSWQRDVTVTVGYEDVTISVTWSNGHNELVERHGTVLVH